MLKPLNGVKEPLRDPDVPICRICNKAPAHPAYGDVCENCAVDAWGCARSSTSRAIFEEKGVDASPEWFKDLSRERQLSRSITELELSVRVLNRLSENGINTIGDLIQKTAEDLLGLRGVREGALAEIKEKLNVLGLKLRES